MEIGDLIGNYAFPIIACLAMGYYVKYREDRNSQLLTEEQKSHKEEMSEVTKALNNNTLALEKISTLVEHLLGRNEK